MKKMNDTGAAVGRERRSAGALLRDVLGALCVAFALTLDVNVRSGNNYHNWFASVPDTPVITVLFVLMLILLRRARPLLPTLGWGSKALGAFLGVWWMLASSVRITQDVKQPFLSSGQMLKALVIAAGMAVLYDLLFRVLAYGLEGRLDWAAAGVRRLRLTQVYREHTLLFCAAALLLMWAGHLACMYPAATNSDTASQIRMVLGLTRFNENHPLLNTAYIGIFLWIGRLLGNANAGLFLCVLSQACFAAAVIGYSQWLMRRLGAPRWLRAGALLVCGLMPVYVYNISVILKDIPYTYAALLLLCEVVRGMFLEEEGYAKSAGFALRWFLAAMLLLTMRNNGMGILAPVTLAWGIRAIRRRDGRLMLRLAALLLIPMLLVSGLKSVYRQGKDTRTVEVDGALSLMLQQTGRFVREHGDEIPPEEREVLEAVFEYDRISGWYDPIISDPMKLAFRNDAQPEEIRQYLRVWAGQFLRDPLCYVKATFIQNALLFDPQTYNLAIFSSLGLPEDAMQALGIEESAQQRRVQQQEKYLHFMLMTLPLAAPLNAVGFYSILLLGVWLIALRKGARGMLPVTLPALATMVMVVLGSTMVNQDRYGFPIVYTMPLVLACLSCALRRAQGEQEKPQG